MKDKEEWVDGCTAAEGGGKGKGWETSPNRDEGVSVGSRCPSPFACMEKRTDLVLGDALLEEIEEFRVMHRPGEERRWVAGRRRGTGRGGDVG